MPVQGMTGVPMDDRVLYSRAEISRHPAANLTLKRAKARAPERGIYAASTVVVWVECQKFYAQRYTTPFFARIGTMNGETTRPPSGGDAVDPSSAAVWLSAGTATLLKVGTARRAVRAASSAATKWRIGDSMRTCPPAERGREHRGAASLPRRQCPDPPVEPGRQKSVVDMNFDSWFHHPPF